MLVALAVILAACGRVVEQPIPESEASLILVATDGEPFNAEGLDGSTVVGVIQILVEVKGKKVSEVRFHLDGAATPIEVDTSEPFELVLDTTSLSDGVHLIVAVTPVGRGSSTRELVRAEFTVANGGVIDDPVPADPVPDPDPAPAPDPSPVPIDGVLIRVGDVPAVVVASHPAGTVFVFEAGVHRLSGPIVPRDGDSFVGERGAVLSGSRLLTSFEREGGLWVVVGQTQAGWRSGECQEGVPRCRYPEDLFVDDVPLQHVGSLGEVVSGAWFFDYEADRIYFADDPTGRIVETSVVSGAFVGDADDVTIRGLVIEKFATPAARGAVMSVRYSSTATFGERWVIEDNTIQLNHGAGLKVGHGARIVNNRVLRNGQLGVGGGWGFGTLVEGNEIAYNNWVGFDWGWEAGGTKWAMSDGLVVRNNHAHHNNGPGLWTDESPINTLYEYNLVESNASTGIFHEISYSATIRHNVVLNNGIGRGYEQYMYVFGAGIVVASSPDVSVYGNVVKGNWNGIVALQGNRGSGPHGEYHVRNLHVYDNDIEMRYWSDGVDASGSPRGVHGMTGLFRNGGPEDVWGDSFNNRFERNRYTSSSGTTRHWSWKDVGIDFARWQAHGQDLTGATGISGSFRN
jgi:hypothetical protein